MPAGMVIAVVQARLGSTRLPGKVLKRLGDRTVLQWVLDRLSRAERLEEIVVATTNAPHDEPIAQFCEHRGVSFFRYSEDDVLSRFVGASNAFGADWIVRVSADNPLLDPSYVDQLVAEAQRGDWDYLSFKRGDGRPVMLTALSFFAEVCSRACLERASRIIRDPFEREHVTLGIYRRPEVFRVGYLDVPAFANDPKLRFTLDTPADYDMLSSVFQELGARAESASAAEVVGMVHAHPDWLEQMANVNLQNPKVTEEETRTREMNGEPVARLRMNADMKPLENIEVAPGRWIGDDQPCFIVAEVGQNHNGEMRIARELIDNIAFFGCDAVKFCKRDILSDLTHEAYSRPYYGPQSFGETYGKHREHLELSLEQYKELKTYAESKGVIFFATACDMVSVEELEDARVTLYKVASRDLTNLPLVDYIASTGKPVILSCGMSTMEEIGEAVETVRQHHNRIVLMQCTSSYPTPEEDVNLRVMHTLRREFDVLVGMSDHTVGIMVPVVAAALGACVVEKHFTLARHMKGTDHACSLEPDGLRRVVRDIRNMEKALGDGAKRLPDSIGDARTRLGRSLVSACEIRRGTVVEEDMLCLKSPGHGLPWRDRYRIVGKTARRDILADVTLNPDDFE